MITPLQQLASFVRLNEEAYNSGSHASYDPPATAQASMLALEHVLEKHCPLTVSALRLVGAWSADLGDFAARSWALGPIGDIGARFLAEATGHAHPLVASVAQFEAAVQKVREGHSEDHVIGWSYSPNLVLAALRDGEMLDLEAARGNYWTIVAPDLPGHYHVLAATRPARGEDPPPPEDRQPVGVRY